MARFLSSEWFAELGAAAEPGPGAPEGEVVAQPEVVVGIVVTGLPEGEVRYQVVVDQGRPAVLPPGAARWPSQVTLTCDYGTLSSLASGATSVIDVLAAGRARISGDTGALSAQAEALDGLDLLPGSVRSRTTF